MPDTTRRTFLSLAHAGLIAPALALGARTHGARLEPGEEIGLWPGDPPGSLAPSREEVLVDRAAAGQPADRAIHGISKPRLAVFRPSRPNGAAILITPGGGYQRVVIDREGFEVAEWLRSCGITTFVLIYRLPAEGWATPCDVALADAQRAMRIIRSRANEYGLDDGRIGAMGFSAGGHLCADLAVRHAIATYPHIDLHDKLSARPCFAAPIYPVVSMDSAIAHPGSRTRLLGLTPTPTQVLALSPDRNVSGETPPHFLVHAEDDRVVPVENTIRLGSTLRAAGITVETHLFAHGGHGFGMRTEMAAAARHWPELWLDWAVSMDFLAAKPRENPVGRPD